MAYLDNSGLTYFWNIIKTLLGDKSDKNHNHSVSEVSGFATVATTGSYNDLNNKPTIPTIPSTLPANGGNADTIDNKHIITASSAPTTNDTSIITIVI